MPMILKPAIRTHLINILIAFSIGIFVVMPDILMRLDQQMTGTEELHMRPMPPPGPGDKHMEDFSSAPHHEMKPGYSPRIKASPRVKDLFIDGVFYFLLAWILLCLNNPHRSRTGGSTLFRSSSLSNGIIIAASFLLSMLGVYLNFLIHPQKAFPGHPFPWYLDGRMLFKGLFVFISVVLTGQLFRQLARRQNLSLEYERLKNENLQNRFEALAAQVSPHFFFNALNSLSGLIRAKENKKALKYINEISNLFRYILQEKWQELVPLKEELRFLDSYRYLLHIKYGDRLTFNIDLPEAMCSDLLLPAMSLQPLAENIIKHNIVSEEMPMLIRIFIRDGNTLVMENGYQPIERRQEGSGIGLSNLEKRYQYLAGKSIHSYIHEGRFIVELPLIETSAEHEGSDY